MTIVPVFRISTMLSIYLPLVSLCQGLFTERELRYNQHRLMADYRERCGQIAIEIATET